MAVRSTTPSSEVGVGADVPVRAAVEGLRIQRHFCPEGVDPIDQVEWEKRTASIKDEKGEVIFRQDEVLVPSGWTQLATNVVASKYFYGENGKPERENSTGAMICRVTRTITARRPPLSKKARTA